MRREAYKLAARFQAGYACVWVDAPLALVLRRNAARSPEAEGCGVRVDDETIRRMEGRLEPPDPAAHSWEGNFVRIRARGDEEEEEEDREEDGTATTRAAVLACIEAGWRAPGSFVARH
jgi:tRNA uridine 5-carbamoylmethylation protein Kti12